ncbi:MAG: tetratricopeptide repeat protein [Chitinivibrionia bacterium]|nr:tetratricopeptide repeat protein [Chitinivibrionia bacterium]
MAVCGDWCRRPDFAGRGGCFYARSRETSREAAAAQFARALLDYRQGNNQVASMAMQGILDEHDGTDVAEQATFLLGKLSLRQRNYPEAVRYFELYLSQYRDDKLMRAASHAGIAGALENQGQFADAAARYVQAIDEFSDGPLTGDYQLAALRCYVELNDGEKARGLLTELQDKFKGTELANRAARIFGEKFPG